LFAVNQFAAEFAPVFDRTKRVDHPLHLAVQPYDVRVLFGRQAEIVLPDLAAVKARKMHLKLRTLE